MTDSPNLYQAFVGNWTGATDPSGEVVIMMHGINDSGEAWAARMSQALGETWDADGADPGQDVINLVNRQFTPPYPGDCKPDIGEFCTDNALNALKYQTLDKDTMEAGIRTRNALALLRAHLDKAGSYRKGEPLQVLAHSHGTAMLLAAARQNGVGGSSFRLRKAVLVGSDLHRAIDVRALLESADTVINFYSNFDEAVGWAKGAGAVGFEWQVNLVPFYLSGRAKGDLRQIPVRGISHTGDFEETKRGQVPWMSRELATRRYAPLLELRSSRLGVEDNEWLDPYKKLRKQMGLDWTVDLPLRFSAPYVARGLR